MPEYSVYASPKILHYDRKKYILCKDQLLRGCNEDNADDIKFYRSISGNSANESGRSFDRITENFTNYNSQCQLYPTQTHSKKQKEEIRTKFDSHLKNHRNLIW